jgi:hypothetical protein
MNERVLEVIEQQKGELIFLRALTAALFRAMGTDAQARALHEFDEECKAARDQLLHMAPDSILDSFELHVKSWNDLRTSPPA